jgi:hypothetical protein
MRVIGVTERSDPELLRVADRVVRSLADVRVAAVGRSITLELQG